MDITIEFPWFWYPLLLPMMLPAWAGLGALLAGMLAHRVSHRGRKWKTALAATLGTQVLAWPVYLLRMWGSVGATSA